MERKLRIHTITVQIGLAYDDGEELTPGPALNPVVVVSLSEAQRLLDGLPEELRGMQERLDAQTRAE